MQFALCANYCRSVLVLSAIGSACTVAGEEGQAFIIAYSTLCPPQKNVPPDCDDFLRHSVDISTYQLADHKDC